MLLNSGETLKTTQRWTLRGALLILVFSITLALLAWWSAVAELETGNRYISTALLMTGIFTCTLVAGLVTALFYTRKLASRMLREMKEALRHSEVCWGQAMTGLGSGLTDWNLATGVTTYSPRWYEMLGLDPAEVGSSSEEWMKRVHPDDLPLLTQRMHALFQGNDNGTNHEFRMQHADGSWRWMLGNALIHSRDAAGRPLRLIGTNLDITERKRIEDDLRLSALVFNNSSEAMSVADARGHIITVNPAFMRITGYDLEEVRHQPTALFGLDQTTLAAIIEASNTIGHWHGEIWCKRKDGDVYPVSIAVNTIFDRDAQPYRYVSLFSDITNRKQAEELLWRQANFDALTHLFNRSMFHERVGQEIKQAQRSGSQLALLFIDLDHFKEVNDTLGHDTGDHLLLEAARRITSCVRETDAVARLGGDEFTVLLAGLDDNDTTIVERIASNLLEELTAPFDLGDEVAHVSASVGITLYPRDASDIDGLFRNADQAMYLSKAQGRNRFSYFTPELQASAQNRLRLINDLRIALAEEQFSVHFQPIVDLGSGRIVKAEALLRWRHPQRGMVMPDTFIPLTEETGMIHDIGDWVFREAAHWLARWRTGHHAGFQMAINKSPIQFQKNNHPHADWLTHLNSLGLPGNSLTIEITEGVLLNAESEITTALLDYRDAGIQIAIDDFGTGYSSLAYLNKFDIDYLKIDRSFIRNLAPNSSDMALSEAIIVMAHKLGLKVIAEGVETPAQRELLASVGCDYVQGYLFSRPLPPEEFEYLLRKDERLL